MTEPADLIGKLHADKTQKHWVDSCEKAYRAPEPCGALAAKIGDLLEAWVDRRTELGKVEHDEVMEWCKRMGLNGLDVWNGVKAMAYLLPRTSADAGDNSS